MFWVMMYMLFFSGSAAPELLIPDEEVLRKAIKDEQRLENVLAIREEVINTEQDLAELFKSKYGDLAKLSPQYEADSNQFRIVFEELDTARVEAQSLWLDKRFHLKEQMTLKEWQRVYGSR